MVNVALLGTAAYKSIEYMDSSAFCGLTCHTGMPPEYSAFLDTAHSRVGCAQGAGGAARAQTLAFTTLVLFQLWNVFARRSEESSTLVGLFTNRWLWLAVLSSLGLQALAVHWPPFQRALGTVGLRWDEWAFCLGVSSLVVWLGEVPKLWRRAR